MHEDSNPMSGDLGEDSSKTSFVLGIGDFDENRCADADPAMRNERQKYEPSYLNSPNHAECEDSAQELQLQLCLWKG